MTRLPGALILAAFAVMLTCSMWSLFVVLQAPPSTKSWDFLGDANVARDMADLGTHLRTAVVGMFVFAALGCCTAIGILRTRRRGWFGLAGVLSVGALVLLAIRLSGMAPRPVVPDWPLVLAFAGLAALCCWHIFKMPPNNGGEVLRRNVP
jgi:hypothetical protein